MRFAKFLKRVELRLLTYRDGFQVALARKDKFSKEFVDGSVVVVNPNTAKTFGFKDGQVVRLRAGERWVRMRLKVDEISPEGCALMHSGIYANYLSSDRVVIEADEGEPTTPDEILKELVT